MSQPDNGTAENPSQPAPKVRLVSIPKDGVLVVRFLGSLKTCYVHWERGKSVPCPGEDKCPRKRHEENKHWRAYVCVEYWRPAPNDDWFPGVLEVTENFGDKLLPRTLPGEVWRVYRARSTGKHKECTGTFHEAGRPPMVDVRFWIETVIFRLYRTLDIEWGVDPIIPPPVVAEPRKAPPPQFVREGKPKEEVMSKEAIHAALVKAGLRSENEKAVKI